MAETKKTIEHIVENVVNKRLEPHEPDYKSEMWKRYSLGELASFVQLLSKRAGHRSTKEKAAKDMYDAKNYLAMLEQKVIYKAEKLGIDFGSL